MNLSYFSSLWFQELEKEQPMKASHPVYLSLYLEGVLSEC